MDADLRKAYHKKSETVRWGKRRIVLDIPVDVFSSHRVDVGTAFLLRQMASAGVTWPSALDVGCGYGPIALFLASQGLSERVHGIDRDALAVAFAERNAGQNGVSGVTFEPGLAYGAVLAINGDYFGNPVNLAARLVASAAPGQILIDAQLHTQLPRWSAAAHGPLTLKGFDAPVTAYELHRLDAVDADLARSD